MPPMPPMPPNITSDGDLSFQRSSLIFYVNGKKVNNIAPNNLLIEPAILNLNLSHESDSKDGEFSSDSTK